MGSVVDDAVDVLLDIAENILDFAVSTVRFVWEEISYPVLTEIFSFFGITAETVVETNKISTKLFGKNDVDVVSAAKKRALLFSFKTDVSLWKHILFEMQAQKSRVQGYYTYGKNTYVNGLPSMVISGENVKPALVKTTIDADKEIDCTVINVLNKVVSPLEHFKDQLQSSPTNYKPGLDELTYPDQNNQVWNDWKLHLVEYLSGTDEYEITIRREAENTIFWLQAPDDVTEGNTVKFYIKCNRPIPAGQNLTVNLTYGGTANPEDFSAPLTALIPEGEKSVEVSIAITENAAIETLKTVTPTIASVDNSAGIFEFVTISPENFYEIDIYDNDSAALLMDSKIVNHLDTSVTIPVTLTQAATGPFTVDYEFVDGAAVNGLDYVGTNDTLSFGGAEGESLDIVVPLSPDLSGDEFQDFKLRLINCSDPSIDISKFISVVITDLNVSRYPLDNTTNEIIFTRPSFVEDQALIARYYEGENEDDWYYWIYYFSSETYPDLIPQLNTITNLEMLPAAILRKDKVTIDADKETEEYKTTRVLLRRLGIEIEDVIEGINDNPDLGNIDDVYINFAISPSDEGKLISKMLFLTFYELTVVHNVFSGDGKYLATFEEGDINNAMSWTDQSFTESLSGVVTSVGDYIHEIVEEVVTEPWSGRGQSTIPVTYRYLYIRHQKTEELYDEILISNLVGFSSIKYQQYSKTAYQNVTEKDFTIPLSWFVFSKLKNEEFMQIYQDVIRTDFYAIQTIYLEWYETADFLNFIEFVLTIVAIISTIFSLGAASGFWSAVWIVFKQVAISYIVKELVLYIAKETGSEVLAAIVGALVLIYLGDASGLSNSGLLSAESLTLAVTSFVDNVEVLYGLELEQMSGDINELLQEQERLEGFYEENGIDETTAEAYKYARMMTADDMVYLARDMQYDYDSMLMGSYDRIITKFHETLLTLDFK